MEVLLDQAIKVDPDILECVICHRAWRRKFPMDPRNVEFLNGHVETHPGRHYTRRVDLDAYDEEADSGA